jgi:cell division protein FtsN
MEQRDAETGAEFVLDSRKLIIMFVLLMVVCGTFYTIGFMEGKRQSSVPPRVEVRPPEAVPAVTGTRAESNSKANTSAAQGGMAGDRAAHEELNWYKSVQGVESEAQKSGDVTKSATPTPSETKPTSTPPTQADKTAPASERGSNVQPARIIYSVQVGAFRQRREAEIKAAALKAKGYASEVDLPQSGDQIYLVVVGKFNSRSDAVMMQRKLQKDGFSCFIREK